MGLHAAILARLSRATSLTQIGFVKRMIPERFLPARIQRPPGSFKKD